MQNKWEKNARATRVKAFAVALLIHAVFFAALAAYSASGSESGGLLDLVNSKSKQQTEEAILADGPRS